MDAKAHLLSLGWAGPGHALDSRPYKQTGKRGLDYTPNTGTGLIKPLMISQRKERFGIGKKDPKHEPAAGNEWWLKGFETALGNIGKAESERSGTQTPVIGQGGGKHAGLYGFFVKGKEMEGTMGEEVLRGGRKRKSDRISVSPSDEENEEEEKQNNGSDVFVQTAAFITVRDKHEKRRRRVEKAGAVEEFEQATTYFEARSGRKEKKKPKSHVESDAAGGVDGANVDGPVREETKEERRARRRKRKEERAAREAMLEGGDGDSSIRHGDDTSKRKEKHERRGQR